MCVWEGGGTMDWFGKTVPGRGNCGQGEPEERGHRIPLKEEHVLIRL